MSYIFTINKTKCFSNEFDLLLRSVGAEISTKKPRAQTTAYANSIEARHVVTQEYKFANGELL